jgi:hypothetical protein
MTKVKTGVVYAFAANVNAHLRCVSLALLFLAELFGSLAIFYNVFD